MQKQAAVLISQRLGLSNATLPQTLGEFCQSVGEVRYATVYMDPEAWMSQHGRFKKPPAIFSNVPEDSGSSNGTGKVDFDCRETAEKALRELNGSTLDGAQITVQSLADVPLHFWSLGSQYYEERTHEEVPGNTMKTYCTHYKFYYYIYIYKLRRQKMMKI